MATKHTNDEIAVRLRRHADELAACGENLYRVRAFRQAALAVLALDRPAADLGIDGLAGVRGIGKSLAGTIGTFAETGEWVVRTALDDPAPLRVAATRAVVSKRNTPPAQTRSR